MKHIFLATRSTARAYLGAPRDLHPSHGRRISRSTTSDRSSGSCRVGAARRGGNEALRRAHGGKVLEGLQAHRGRTVNSTNRARAVRKPGSVGLPMPASTQDRRPRDGHARGGRGRGGGAVSSRAESHGRLLAEAGRGRGGPARRLFYTGDIAGWTRRIPVRGRPQEGVIIVSGFKVYPREVDEVLYAHPACSRPPPWACRIRQGRGREGLRRVASRRQGDGAGAHGSLPREPRALKVPVEIVFRAELPKTLIGKVLGAAGRRRAGIPHLPLPRAGDAPLSFDAFHSLLERTQ